MNTSRNTQAVYPSPATTRLLDLLQIRFPIIQAPAGGVVSNAMTAAVSNCGGLGGIPLSWSSPEEAASTVAAVRQETSNPFFVNFVLSFEPVALEAALESGAAGVQFSWGMPDEEMIASIRSARTVMGIQVTSRASAEAAINAGADYLVCQGTEAGGHVHASRPLARALQEVLGVAGDVPVVASGGIANGQSMHKYIAMGAAGVVMGSRFVASEESAAHKKYKDALVRATSEQTVFTTCMNKGWDNAQHRILRNSTFEMWESAGCPARGQRPGESDIVARLASNKEYEVERYSINSPGVYYEGNVEAMAAYAGTGVDEIVDLPPVSEIMSRTWEEFQTALNG